jgi:hypothetical protein
VGSGWELSHLAQVCTSSLTPVSALEDLYMDKNARNWSPKDIPWPELLHPFVAVKNLYVAGRLVSGIALALQELVEGRKTEILPNLENIFLAGFKPSGTLHEVIEKYVAARRSSHPVVVSRCTRQYVFLTASLPLMPPATAISLCISQSLHKWNCILSQRLQLNAMRSDVKVINVGQYTLILFLNDLSCRAYLPQPTPAWSSLSEAQISKRHQELHFEHPFDGASPDSASRSEVDRNTYKNVNM